MKMNNVKLEIYKGVYLSIAQHCDESGEMICNEMALINENGLQEPLQFIPNLSDFMKCVSETIKGERT